MAYEKKIKVTPELKKQLKKNFFSLNKPQFPSWYARDILLSYVFLLIGIFLAFYLDWSYAFTYFVILVFIALAFHFAYKWITPYLKEYDKFKLMPSKDQMENWLIKDIKDIVKPAAVDMLSLNPLTINPENFLIVIHPVYWSVAGVDRSIITRKNVGGYFIYTIYKIQIIALSENYISFYSCIFNWIDNQIINPYTLEFFFEDISSITSEVTALDYYFIDKEPKKKENEDDEEYEGEKIGSAKVVYIHNKSGEKMEIFVEIPDLQASPRISLKAEKVMQVLRIMLRHRRFGELFFVEKKEDDTEEKKEKEN